MVINDKVLGSIGLLDALCSTCVYMGLSWMLQFPSQDPWVRWPVQVVSLPFSLFWPLGSVPAPTLCRGSNKNPTYGWFSLMFSSAKGLHWDNYCLLLYSLSYIHTYISEICTLRLPCTFEHHAGRVTNSVNIWWGAQPIRTIQSLKHPICWWGSD